MRLIKGKTYYTKPWYPSWHSMLDRCENPNVHNYPLYGGRGIKVCEEWHNIEQFEKWVKTSGWKEGLTIDRIDVDGMTMYCANEIMPTVFVCTGQGYCSEAGRKEYEID